MFKKAMAVLACAAAFSAPALAAIDNAGFEAGNTSSWGADPTLTAVTSAVVPWVDGNGDVTSSTITPVSGNYFGLWQVGAPPTTTSDAAIGKTWSSWNFGTAISTDTDMVWLRLVTNDWYFATPCAPGDDVLTCGFNDYVEVYYTGIGGSPDRVEAVSTGGPDSGWLGFAVPNGATGLQINVIDYYNSANNGDPTLAMPTVAIDYGVSPIPEPSTVLMMLAGLGALGMKGRRRQSTAATSAAA